jgi:MFS family permease
LSAGVRALPFALAMGALSPVSSLLTRRLGVRRVIPAGLALMGLGVLWLAQAQPATAYAQLAGAVAIMGAGMGLVMAPASEAIMNSLPPEQAGVGSAVNDTVREVGGALGVAVIGSLVSAGYRSGLHLGSSLPASVPASVAAGARSSIAAADALGPVVRPAAHAAFTTAMDHGFEVAGAAALVGAVLAWWRLPNPA